MVLDAWLACDSSHRYASETCGLSVPRQNGKNAVLEMVELFKVCVQGRKVLHTAHEVKTCRKAFLRLKSFFEQPEKYPELAAMVLSIRATNGQECIQLGRRDEAGDMVPAGSVEFIARSKSSGRGFTVDDVVCDEAQEMTDEQLEVLRSTNSAAPSGNPQFLMTGTPTPPTSPGTVFERTRRSAIEVGDVTDMGRVEATNPALGYRLQESVIEGELASMEPAGFARERLGWWVDRGASALISEQEWEALAIDPRDTPAGAYPDKKAFGVKFSPDGAKMAVAVAVLKPDGGVHVELVDGGYRPASAGVRWITDFLCDPDRRRGTAAVAVDGKGGASVLADQLSHAKYPPRKVMTPGANGVIAASTMLLESVRDGTLTHIAQPALDASATGSARRDIGSQGGWSFDGDESCPIEAASLALWAVKTTRVYPGRKTRMQ